ncbi:LysR family transcriptional regulator [Niveispirillum sp. BGYR6]|uniref:LysR family transcriptional regulator n=1 Tax=Niveispirillum sp. BGYR6 TaxID=2971249 RepID=UPI0022B94C7D|nr:LysR family transcriptional regulator [Niveispirillum sp. BGYR6]MDG5496365.1 LysR family transcriptional regulator [Niveispirillum sp. BGYR6]
MDRLQAMQVFVRVVDANGFARAADTLGLPRASVTTIIQNLEAYLGVRLLQRTTRRLNLTLDGAAYYERAQRILADIEEVEGSFFDEKRKPRGRLHVDMPTSIGRLIVVPSLCGFNTLYPDIELKLGMSDRPIDLIQEGVDCVLRVGDLPVSSSLVARRIGLLSRLTCASPAYLDRYGVPASPDDLALHKGVRKFTTQSSRLSEFHFTIDGESVERPIRSAIAVNDSEAYVACGLEGYGLLQPGRFMVLPHLQSGALVEVLAPWRPAPVPVHVAYPQSRQLSPRVRVFIDWIIGIFQGCPLLQGEDGLADCGKELMAASDESCTLA